MRRPEHQEKEKELSNPLLTSLSLCLIGTSLPSPWANDKILKVTLGIFSEIMGYNIGQCPPDGMLTPLNIVFSACREV